MNFDGSERIYDISVQQYIVAPVRGTLHVMTMHLSCFEYRLRIIYFLQIIRGRFEIINIEELFLVADFNFQVD